MTDSERRGWLRLSLTPGVAPAAARQLLSLFGLPDAIFAARREELFRATGEALAGCLLAPEPAEAIGRALAWLGADSRRSLLTLADSDYPQALLQLADAPALLYLHGRRELLGRPALAIVGSRRATRQGEINAETFAAHLAGRGLTIVSGLARGIDAAAHRGALACGADASTIAILGTGADAVYPESNRELACHIAQHGLLVSEYPLGTPPVPHNFPRRNRLIAAASRGVLVVEAAPHSGSLITARMAAELGREVMAIPGSIHSPLARGCHRLIGDGARLVETAQDVLDELAIEPLRMPISLSLDSHPVHGADIAGPGLAQLLQSMGYDPVDVDTLARRTGLAPGPLAAQLLELEMTQHVERLAGNSYQRLRRP